MDTTTTATTADTRPSDADILAHQKAVAAPFLSAPLVGSTGTFDGLALQLKDKAVALRHVRKDGNCFYRAFSFALLEALLNYAGSNWAKKSDLTNQGYDPIITDDFYEPIEAALKDDFTEDKLRGIFEGDGEYQSDTIVCYLRLVTAAELKKNRDLYEAFILDSYPTIDEFIAQQVEPMAIESDQIHIVAIANAIGVTVNVANLDSSDSDLNFHDITPMMPLDLENSQHQPVVSLLYRPGHYDIVYLK
ncbi:cysteine proteinase [Rhizoclosmatium globosum]|uniref:ubiquitinyl hydrolase 1 n=1 Tax=Rhizoclosmatium globosum TaxID=329046 RepID=A0A1Y2BZ69_9FUNG|nr:cysteine proteinase [Rhizoclosmatium globosum]|eukprot:ORY39964.1 cysteine proteinase [Rhizoclosmatium globosum]